MGTTPHGEFTFVMNFYDKTFSGKHNKITFQCKEYCQEENAALYSNLYTDEHNSNCASKKI